MTISFFAVLRNHGPAWDQNKSMREQAGWDSHAQFMDNLVDQGFTVLGGPLVGTQD